MRQQVIHKVQHVPEVLYNYLVQEQEHTAGLVRRIYFKLAESYRTNLTTAHSGVYTLVVTSPNGCTATATTTVSVVAPPVVLASVEDNSVCEGSSVFLHSSGASSYQWAGPYGYTSSYQHPIITNIPIYLSGTYTVTGTGPTGCTANAGVVVNVAVLVDQLLQLPIRHLLDECTI